MENDENYLKENIIAMYHDVYKFIYFLVKDAQTARDLAQSTMERAWMKSDQLRDKERIKSRLFQIARNETAQHFNDREVIFSYDESEPGCNLERYVSSIQDLSAIPVDREQSAGLMEALNLLSLRYREIVYLWALGRLNQKEIAEILQISHAAVRNYLRRGLIELRDICFTPERDGSGK